MSSTRTLLDESEVLCTAWTELLQSLQLRGEWKC